MKFGDNQSSRVSDKTIRAIIKRTRTQEMKRNKNQPKYETKEHKHELLDSAITHATSPCTVAGFLKIWEPVSRDWLNT